jgi:hypothetical protein
VKSPIASLKEAKDYFAELPAQIDTRLDDSHRQSFAELMEAIDQFFNILASINMQASENHVISSTEATDIGEHGFILLLKTIDLMDKLDLPHKRKEVEQVSLIFARWIIRYRGRIVHLEPVVNACAQLANLLQDKKALKVLYSLMTQIADGCTTEIKQDLEASDHQLRPWRLLHINRSIVATRSHDPEMMKKAFDELLVYLPHEADGFFAEGMKEMEALNYPPHVRNLMEFYYAQKPSMSMH